MNLAQYQHDLLGMGERTGVTQSLTSVIANGLVHLGYDIATAQKYLQIYEQEVVPLLVEREEVLGIDLTAIPDKLLQELLMRLGDDDAGGRKGSSLRDEIKMDQSAGLGSKSPEELLAEWAGWELGDPSWARTFLRNYEALKGAMIHHYEVLAEQGEKTSDDKDSVHS